MISASVCSSKVSREEGLLIGCPWSAKLYMKHGSASYVLPESTFNPHVAIPLP